MGFLSDRPVATAMAVLFAVWFVRFSIKFTRHRRKYGKLPGPPHSFFFGHLIVMGELTKRIPNKVHPHVHAYHLRKMYNLPRIFYLDMYPIAGAICMVLDTEAAQDISTVTVLEKHEALVTALEPLAGAANLVTTDGPFWKRWRSIFNPGFSVQHLMGQVPYIVDLTKKYTDILDKHAATGLPFRLEEEATKIAVDVIGNVVADHDFDTLTTNNEFVDNMRKQLEWTVDKQSLNPFHHYHPLRPFMVKYYNRKMSEYVGKVLDERFAARDIGSAQSTRKRIGIDLALEAYLKETGKDVDTRAATMNAEFRRIAIDNILMLLFAGHDTTASTLCYAYYLLSRHPDKLAKVRQELDSVFGVGVDGAEALKRDPYVLNKCEYTLAIIKETLRLWPPASTVRKGRDDYFLKDTETGQLLPTNENVLVWVVAMSMQRDPEHFGPTADSFIPERFMPCPDPDLDPSIYNFNPHAWRPFEKGPRNCIGQELVLIELKVILALTLREFDFKPAYDECGGDVLANDGSLWAKEANFKNGPVQECFGEEAYQVLLAAGKPRDGLPVRVSRRL